MKCSQETLHMLEFQYVLHQIKIINVYILDFFNIWAGNIVSQHPTKGDCRGRTIIWLSSFLCSPAHSLIPCQSCAWHKVDIRPSYSTGPPYLALILVLEWPQLADCHFVGSTLTDSGRYLLVLLVICVSSSSPLPGTPLPSLPISYLLSCPNSRPLLHHLHPWLLTPMIRPFGLQVYKLLHGCAGQMRPRSERHGVGKEKVPLHVTNLCFKAQPCELMCSLLC